jgi:hypothetical protein
MISAYKLIGIVGCLFASLCAGAQAVGSTRKIVLPNPKLIHCHSVTCSQLWKEDSVDGEAVYPAQLLTDLVNGEIVGLTAVYEKSVSIMEIRAAFDAFYGKWRLVLHDDTNDTKLWLWRVEPEQLVIQLSDRDDGVKQVTYLKVGTFSSHVPAAHIDSEHNDCQ